MAIELTWAAPDGSQTVPSFHQFTIIRIKGEGSSNIMAGRTGSVIGGIALGALPMGLLTSAATGSLAWAIATAICVVIGGTALLVLRARGNPCTEHAVAWTGLIGGAGLIAVGILDRATITAFPGPPAVIWVLAAVMIVSSIPVFRASAKPPRPPARLRTIRIIEDTTSAPTEWTEEAVAEPQTMEPDEQDMARGS